MVQRYDCDLKIDLESGNESSYMSKYEYGEYVTFIEYSDLMARYMLLEKELKKMNFLYLPRLRDGT